MNRTKISALAICIAAGGFATGCGDDEPETTDAGVTTVDMGGTTTDMGADAGMTDTGTTAATDAGMTDVGMTDGGSSDAGTVNAACQTALSTAVAAADFTGYSAADPTSMVATGGSQNREADYAGKYRDDLANHPGCMPRSAYDANSEAFITDNEATVPAGSPYAATDYPCAAKEYDKSAVDTSKEIVILVHGNSSGVVSFEEYFVASRAGTDISNVAMFTFTVDSMVRTQLASTLLTNGYEVISFDARTDLVSTLADYNSDPATGNAFNNIDHGWAVPMLQQLVKSVMTANPTRKVSIIGHSLGVTVIRDTMRRLWNESQAGTAGAVNPYAQLKDVVLLSGANHGVANGSVLCTSFPTQMRGTVGCEMGSRDAFTPTDFSRANNGPDDVWTVPCADGDYAFGVTGACGGNVVEYTTVTMQDIPGGMLQDEFVSEASSRLDVDTACVDNELISLTDYDASSFFLTILPGFFANHFGSARSNAGIQLIMDKLGD